MNKAPQAALPMKGTDGQEIRPTKTTATNLKHPVIHPLPPFSDLFRRTWENYKQSLGVYTALAAIGIALVIPYGAVAVWSAFAEGREISLLADTLLVVLGIAGGILQTMLLVAMYTKTAHPEYTVKEALAAGRQRFWPFLWAMILVGLAFLGGLFLFVIPAVVISLWLMFVGVIASVENISGLRALQMARLLVKGRWWAVCGRTLLMNLIFMAISLPVVLLTLGTGAPLLQLFLGPLSAIFTYQLYSDLKQTKKVASADVDKKGWPLFWVLAGPVMAIVLVILLISALAGIEGAFNGLG